MDNNIDDYIADWEKEINYTCKQSSVLCIALFSNTGEMLFANPGFSSLLKNKAGQSFINPTIGQLLEKDYNNPLIFNGLMTFGDESFLNTTISGRVYRKNDQLLIIGEVDVKQLSDQNEKMIYLNKEIVNLQRQIIKEKKTLELTLKQLKEINNSKDKLFSIIAHDLKNPFSTILGFSDMLKENYITYDSIKLGSIIDNLNTSANMAFELLENLLMWAKSQRDSIEYNPVYIPLKDRVLSNFKIVEKQAEKKNITLLCLVDEDIEVIADKNMLDLILRNLLTNAVKFTYPKGNVTVFAIKNEKIVEIAVIDTGVGIREEILEKMFRLDSHITNKGTENESGTGLGLILCKEFVEKHGGKIWVESKIDKGSAFRFTIPLRT